MPAVSFKDPRVQELFSECFVKLEKVGDSSFECVVHEAPPRTKSGIYSALIKNRAFHGRTPFEAMFNANKFLAERHFSSEVNYENK